jgi:hypothetical protein
MPKKRSMTTRKTTETAAAIDEEPIVRANIYRSAVPSASFVSLYTNDTQIQVSPWDFRFLFGIIATMPSPEDPNVQVNVIGEVRMSPQHAKKVSMVLIRQLQNYEQNVGPIPQPAEPTPNG